jgi:protein-tyrosine phosphatase
MAPAEHRVLMVCMGNICRSPMAEALLRHHARERGLDGLVDVDSAGTHSYHLGHPPHPETVAELSRNGIDVGEQRSRLIEAADLTTCTMVLAMDRENLDRIEELAADVPVGTVVARTGLLLDFASGANEAEVPDPYYVGGYDVVYQLVDAGCRGLLDELFPHS